MKPLLLFISLLFSIFNGYAQSNTEAKAAYLLAEESYGKGDMKASLNYLDMAAAKMGGANAKMLYLKIMAERELANADTSFLTKLDSSIKLFEKAAYAKDFNEEKSLEVMKIKLQLNEEIALKSKANTERILNEAGIKAFEAENPDWPMGASLAVLKAKHPLIFKELATKAGKYSISTSSYGVSYQVPKATTGVVSFVLKSDRLIMYLKNYFEYTNDDSNYSKGKTEFNVILEKFRKQFGYLPKPTVRSSEVANTHTCYTWQTTEKALVLNVVHYTIGNLFTSTCSVNLMDQSFGK